MSVTKIYIGCSLTHAPDEFKQAVETIKQNLKTDYEIFDFLGLEKGTPADVYQWDIHRCVAESDLFVAICDYPAIGLGYEIGVAVEKFNKPVLALAHQDTHVTRLLLGIDTPAYAFQRYQHTAEVPSLIRQKVLALNDVKDTK